MTNGEKYKTAKERYEAFNAFCESHNTRCETCPIEKACDDGSQKFAWLELEAEEEKPLPCPFCGGRTYCKQNYQSTLWYVQCSELGCDYRSCSRIVRSTAIDEHNRIVRAAISQKTKNK